MLKQTSTLSSYGVAIARAIDSYNIDSKTLFKQAGLDIDIMKNPNARFADEGLNRLVQLSVSQTSDEGFGLTLANYITPTTFHALGFSLLASETLLSLFQRLQRYYQIVSDSLNISVEQSKKECRIILQASANSPAYPLTDALLAVLLAYCRRLRNPEFAPLALTMCRPETNHTQRFSDYFAAPIEYEAEQDTILFDKTAIIEPLPTGNAELAYQNDKVVADYLARFDNARLSERVRTIFIERLVTGKFSEEQIAEQLNLSLRSLQRRLQHERTSYQQLLDETRLELSLQYINRTQLSVAQIAPLLGFSDSSNFNRAFKRWLGISPSKYRALGFA